MARKIAMTNKTNRKSISKKTRFEVFKRDGFCCQYCGKSAPDVVLEVDHIDPVSKGGADELLNYVTACRDCNAGKSDRTLDDNSVLQKQRLQLQELSERREQLAMMLEWRNGLKSIKEEAIDVVCTYWEEQVNDWHINDYGRKQVQQFLRKYELQKVLDAIDTACARYMKQDGEGQNTADSVQVAWSKVGGILAMSTASEETRQIHYIKGILRNRLSYIPANLVQFLKAAVSSGMETEELKDIALNASSWTRFRNEVEATLEQKHG